MQSPSTVPSIPVEQLTPEELELAAVACSNTAFTSRTFSPKQADLFSDLAEKLRRLAQM